MHSKTIRLTRIPALLAMLSLTACASVKSTPPTDRATASNTDHTSLINAAKGAIDRGQLRVGYDYLLRALAMPQSDYRDRLLQVYTASRLGYNTDAVDGLTLLMQRWPEQAITLDSRFIVFILRKASPPPSAALPLLRALYAANWKLKGSIEPSGIWRDFALQLLESGELTEAVDVSHRVTDAYDLIAMRADQRFEALVAANPAQFDIDAAAHRDFRTLQTASEGNPQSLELKTSVIVQLLHQQRYAAMLAASDSLVLEISSTNYPERLFEDYAEQYHWLLNERATALERAGRWDEAVAQMAAASLLPEDNAANVSQLINLSELYCNLHRPGDALAALGKVGKTSAYGAMELEQARLDASVQLGDAAQTARSLRYLHEHRADHPWAYQRALIVLDQLDDAAQSLVARLLDPEQRLSALLYVQTYAQLPSTPRVEEMRARKRAVIARTEVQAALQKVGRADRYNLEEEEEE